jgi:uncharacterized delta-60 repeat protein
LTNCRKKEDKMAPNNRTKDLTERVRCIGGVLLLLLTLALPQLLLAQPDTLWTRTYGGTEYDWGHSVVQTSDGGYIVAGYTGPNVPPEYDVYLIRTDSNGDPLWTETYGGTGDDRGYSVGQTSDGGYIVAGSYGTGLSDVYLIRTDSDGDILWTETYGGDGIDIGRSVAVTSDGGYIVAGRTTSYGAGYNDVYLIRTNSSGDSLWAKTYGGDENDYGYSVAETSDGGYILAGETFSFGAGGGDVYLIRTNSSGDSLWAKIYGGDNYDRGSSVAQTSDGGYIVAGRTISYGAGGYDVYLIRTDSNGDIIWTKTYGGTDGDEGHSVAQTSDGGYIVAGSTSSYGAGFNDVYLIRTDSNGDILWTTTHGGTDYDDGNSVAQTFNGGYIATGYTKSYGAGNSDVYLIRLEPDITVILTPDATTVERGGTLGYMVQVTNNTSVDQTFEYWSDVYLPNGKPYKKNPVFGPKEVTVKAGKTKSGHLSHKVPNSAPLKTYTLCGRIGFHPDDVWDEDCFEFTVIEGSGYGHDGTDWEVIESTF